MFRTERKGYTPRMNDPTPYLDVNAVLHDFLTRVRTVLGERFRGMYLSGSLALGGFSPHSSDIDFVVVTDADLPDDRFLALQAMHARFNADGSPWATEVEAAYIPQDALRRYDPARARHPHMERGADEILKMDQLGSDWIVQRFILREHGVVIAGPDPRTLIDPISPEDLRRSVVTLMHTWWGPMRHDTSRLELHDIGYQPYAVLTMCRILYTLDSGAVVSKPLAARWAQEALDGRWVGLIERALAWRKDRRNAAPGDDVKETLDLIRYTLQRCQQLRLPPSPTGMQGSTDNP